MDGIGTAQETARLRATVAKYRNACRCSLIFAKSICGAFEHPIVTKCRDALAFDKRHPVRNTAFKER